MLSEFKTFSYLRTQGHITTTTVKFLPNYAERFYQKNNTNKDIYVCVCVHLDFTLFFSFQ